MHTGDFDSLAALGRKGPPAPVSQAKTTSETAFATEGPLDAIARGSKKYQRKRTKWVSDDAGANAQVNEAAGKMKKGGAVAITMEDGTVKTLDDLDLDRKSVV